MIAPGVQSDLNGLSNLDTYRVDGEGYNFVRDAIDGARTAGINWVIVGMHQNYISTGRKGVEISHDIINLLIDKKVDLILQAHDRNYQRSHALKCITVESVSPECITDDGSDGIYKKGSGTVIVINGSFSGALYSVNANDSEAGYFAKINSTALGVSKYTVSENQIIGEYLSSQESDFTDRFFITTK